MSRGSLCITCATPQMSRPAIRGICCQCQFIKCVLSPGVMRFPLARLQNESVGIRLIQQHIYESEEVQTDESFFPCMSDECLYD